MTPLWCHKWRQARYQYKLSVRVLLVVAVVVSVVFWIHPVRADTTVIPSIAISERYDSNVLLAPQTFQVPGVRRSDFITTATPKIEVISKERDINARFLTSLSGNVFANNEALNYVGANVAGTVDLSSWIGKYVRGLKLQIADAFSVTPEQPSFQPTVGQQSITNVSDVFARGVQTVRATLYTNTAALTGEYPLTRTIGVQGNYSYSILRVGKILAEQPGQISSSNFFDSNYERWSIGPTYKLGPHDTVSLNYINTVMDFTSKTEFTGGEVTFRGMQGQYVKTLPNWSFAFGGGATVLENANRAFLTGLASLRWVQERGLAVQLQASRDSAPAFFLTGGALISNAVALQIDYSISRRLAVRGIANYALNETAPVSIVTFETYRGSAQVLYSVSPNITASLGYDYNRFSADVGASPFLVNRSLATFSITATWK